MLLIEESGEFDCVRNGYFAVMKFAKWAVDADRPVLATAIHDGHQIRPGLEALLALDPLSRLREEDPWTGEIASAAGSHVIVHRSRFEVDLNRPRHKAVYLTPEDAWGLQVWSSPPDDAQTEESLREYDAFYTRLAEVLEQLIDRHGGFVLYDVHSYNHRRDGQDQPAAPQEDNPVVNLGTGSLPSQWQPVADTFLTSMGASCLLDELIDARSNVRFEGGHLCSWVNSRYGDRGCALAIELKKVFMDEWTNEVLHGSMIDLSTALVETLDGVWEAHQTCR
jgi:N-formylglutamate deformylase